MIKKSKTLKSMLIAGLILVSIFVAFAPNVSAGVVKVNPLISLVHDRAEENVIPKGGVLDINISTSYTLTNVGATFVQNSPMSLIKDSSVSISLQIEEDYEWIDASITNQPAQLKINEPGKSWSSTLSLTVTEQAPAFTLGKVKIIATSSQLSGLFFNIVETTQVFEIPFEVGYWPVVNFIPTDGNFKEVGPLDTAVFPIEINSLSNGETYVQIEPMELSDSDWTVSVPSSVMLSRSDGSTNSESIVQLTIKPPYGFGFHNDRKTFKIRLTPSCLGKPDLKGQSEIMTFNVQSVGMSPGAGYEIPMIVTVLVVVLVGLYVFKRTYKK